MMPLTRQQLQERLIALHQASLQLVEDVSLETLLERIASVACEQAQARYAALGVMGIDGKLEKFISVGMSDAQIKRIAHPPVGLGLLGAIMDTDKPIRIPRISADKRSVGFPRNHPSMNSFLGVPIRLADNQLGQIYLTEKIDEHEFSEEDEQIIQMLAAYAAVAINNARNYEELRQREKVSDIHRTEDRRRHELRRVAHQNGQGEIVDHEKDRGGHDESRLGGHEIFELGVVGDNVPVGGSGFLLQLRLHYYF